MGTGRLSPPTLITRGALCAQRRPALGPSTPALRTGHGRLGEAGAGRPGSPPGLGPHLAAEGSAGARGGASGALAPARGERESARELGRGRNHKTRTGPGAGPRGPGAESRCLAGSPTGSGTERRAQGSWGGEGGCPLHGSCKERKERERNSAAAAAGAGGWGGWRQAKVEPTWKFGDEEGKKRRRILQA